jgi:hypothetical protein
VNLHGVPRGIGEKGNENVMSIPKSIRIMGASFVFTAILSSGGWAAATYIRGADTSCQPDHYYAKDYTTYQGATTYVGVSTYGKLYCAVHDSSSFQHGAANGGGVYGYNYSGGYLGAKACVKYYAASGGSCGTGTSTTSTGNVSINPSFSIWNSLPDDFAYLDIDIKNSGSTAFYGYGVTY